MRIAFSSLRGSRCLLLAVPFLLSCAGRAAAPTAPAAPTPLPALPPLVQVAPPAPPAPVDPKDAPLPIDPATQVVRLENGLTVYVRGNKKPEKRASLRLAVNAGSVLEDENERGLAHFVEHMAFNGLRLFRKREMVEFFERAGMRFGQHTNAYTSFDETVYTFEVPTDDKPTFDKGLLVLQQIATDLLFDPEEVNAERGVVIEEWRGRRGAGMRVTERMFPIMFKGSKYAERLPIGKVEVLEKATPDDLRKFYKKWYRPDLMSVVVVGDMDVAAALAKVREVFGPLPKPVNPVPRPSIPVPDHESTLVAAIQDKEMPNSSVSVLQKMPHRPLRTPRDYRRSLAESLYHRMLNARFNELTRTENPPFLGAGSSTSSWVRPLDVFSEGAGVKPDQVIRGLEGLTREVERVDRFGFTDAELSRAKADLLRRMDAQVKERDKLQSNGFADEAVRHFLTDEAMPGAEAELALHKALLPTITLDELNRLAREWISEKNRVITVEGPASVPLPSEADLLATFKRVQKEPLTAYQEKATSGPLVESLPPPGKVEAERRIDVLGVTEWRLSNGVTVVVKPTDYKNDEIVMQAIGPGGSSLVADKDFLSASHAGDILQQSGFGRFSAADLVKALSGKLVGGGTYIGELEQAVQGSSSPEDLQTLLELVHLSMTAPRRDPQAFAAYQARLGDGLARRSVQPEATFMDRMLETLYAKHPRRLPLVPGDEKKLDLDRVLATYRERFANARGFTFVFVGNVDVAKLKPLVEKYLGSLPAKPKADRWKDIKARPVRGVKRYEVKQGIEPKSVVRINFTGFLPWSREEAHRYQSFNEALTIKLTEAIREELGATYGVGVSGDFSRRPVSWYRSTIALTCDPNKVDIITKRLFDELDKAKKDGLGPVYLEKVQAAQRRSFEEAQKTNGFWRNELVDHYRYGTDPRLTLEREKLIASLSVDRFKKAAARYFDKRNYVMGVLRPEAAPAAAFDTHDGAGSVPKQAAAR